MPRKPMTDEQKAVARENLAKGRAARAARLAGESPQPTEEAPVQPQPVDNRVENADIGDILRRLQELEQDNWRLRSQQQQQSGPQAGAQGLVGTHERYKMARGYYPDPRERLTAEPRLQRFAFPINYELGWEVGVSQYKTIDGVNTKEPNFKIELNRVVMDEDTGEATNGRYTICRGIFHEDPEAALIVAREHGIEVDETDERTFLDEMRYLRIRDWLLDAFYPPKAVSKKNKKEVVIGNKLVEFFEVNSEDSESIPFSQLKNKL